MGLKITDVLFWIFFVAGMVLAFWYLFGSSPPLEQTILILVATSVMKLYGNTGNFYGDLRELKGEFREFKESSNRRFDRLELRFDRLESDLNKRFDKLEAKI